VNNKNISGFDPAVSGYSFLLKNSSVQAPVVKVIPADPAVGVELIQAKGVPGTATITLIDYVTVDKREYSVNFGTKSISDEFNGQVPGNQWSWERENKNDWSLSKIQGSLVIKGQKGDIIGATNTAENILLQSANTDWTIVSKVTFSRKPSAFNQQGGIIALQDDDNFVKLVYRANPRPMRGANSGSNGVLDIIVEKNGNYFSMAGFRSTDIINDNNYSLILKLERKGGLITGSYSRDGKTFSKIGTVEIILKDVKAGLIVCNGSEVGGSFMRMPGMQSPQQEQVDFNVLFDFFRITNTGLK
jgi:hypothetical protein